MKAEGVLLEQQLVYGQAAMASAKGQPVPRSFEGFFISEEQVATIIQKFGDCEGCCEPSVRIYGTVPELRERFRNGSVPVPFLKYRPCRARSGTGAGSGTVPFRFRS